MPIYASRSMNREPFIYIDYVCAGCGADICATNFFIGKRKPCRFCGYESIVPNLPGEGTDRDTESKRHDDQPPRGRAENNKEASYAAILELPLKVTKEQIKKAYKQQLLRYHPDRVEHLGHEFKELAHKKTREITEAYDYFKRAYNL
ncbi:MAG: J domain-containing protein [Verrucomicrobiaceae bacterium]